MKWDAAQRRYEDDNGKPLTAAQIRKHVDDFILSQKELVRAQSQKLIAQEITIDEFFQFMRHSITGWHSIAGQLAYGGSAQMGRKQWKRVNTKILSELEYLNKFQQEVEDSLSVAGGNSSTSGTLPVSNLLNV